MTGPAGDAVYQTALARVAEAGQALLGTIDMLRVGVGQAIAQLPAIGPSLMAQWDKLLVEVQRVIDWFKKLDADIGGDPGAIRQLGEEWVNKVGAVASTQAAALQRGRLPSNGKWEGDAATVYHVGVVSNQTTALSNFKDATDSVNEAVNEIANAIGSFWAAIGVAAVVFLGALATAATFGVTILGIPPAVTAVVLACLAFAAAASAAFVALGNSLDMVDRLFAAATNVQAVQGGWPRLESTDTLSDASVKDNTPSQWRPTP